jgi:hypothetical protein
MGSEKKAVGDGRVTMKVQTSWHRNARRRQGYCDNRGSEAEAEAFRTKMAVISVDVRHYLHGDLGIIQLMS